MLYRIAEAIGCSVSDVLDLSVDELKGWSAYLGIKNGK